MDGKMLRSMSHVDKIVIHKIVNMGKWLFRYMESYQMTEEEIAIATKFSVKKVHDILGANINLTIGDIATLEIGVGNIVRDRIRAIEIVKS